MFGACAKYGLHSIVRAFAIQTQGLICIPSFVTLVVTNIGIGTRSTDSTSLNLHDCSNQQQLGFEGSNKEGTAVPCQRQGYDRLRRDRAEVYGQRPLHREGHAPLTLCGGAEDHRWMGSQSGGRPRQRPRRPRAHSEETDGFLDLLLLPRLHLVEGAARVADDLLELGVAQVLLFNRGVDPRRQRVLERLVRQPVGRRV